MLHPADLALVGRDTDVAGLPLLLDTDALEGWLSQALETRVHIRPRRLRYKPHTSCVLAADLVACGRTQPVLVSAYSPAGTAKQTKTIERAPAGSVLADSSAMGVLVTTPAADRDLPALAVLDDPSGAPRLLRRLLGRQTLSDGPLTTLRYNPQRRWVGLLQTATQTYVTLRVYPPRVLRQATQGLRALHHGAPCTPRLLGTDPASGVAAVQYLPGCTLHEYGRTQAWPTDASAFEAAGAALARLHGRDVPGLVPIPPTAQAKATHAAGQQLTALLPELREILQPLTATIVTRLLAQEEVRRPVHGDFSLDQVVMMPDGRVGVIDLDSAHLGDPAADLACAAAAMAHDVVLDLVTQNEYEHRLAALHAGYADHRDLPESERLATHEAAHLLRRSVEPFRQRLATDWATPSRQLVARAHAALNAPSVSGGVR